MAALAHVIRVIHVSGTAAIVGIVGAAPVPSSGCLPDRSPLTTPDDAGGRTGQVGGASDLGADDAALGDDRGGAAATWLRVEDTAGGSHSPDAAPRRPTFVVHAPIDASDPATFPVLFHGSFDPTLEDDAGRAPWLRASLDRVVDAAVEPVEGGVRIRPRGMLTLGARYVLVVPAWAHRPGGSPRGAPRAFPIQVGRSEAGAVLVETFPATGSVGVPIELEAVALRFDDALDPRAWVELHLEREGPVLDTLVASTTESASCAELGLEPRGASLDPGTTHCLRVRLDRATPLVAHGSYRVTLDRVRDRFGDRLADDAPVITFSTAESGHAAPATPILTSCAIGERRVAAGCVLELDDSVSFRTRLAAPARIMVAATAEGVGRTSVTRAGEAELVVDGLARSRSLRLRIVIHDLAGVEVAYEADVATTEALPRLVIEETRADAIGPDPAQEYVELRNDSAVTVDLGGYRLADSPERAGDLLPAPSLVPPGARVLLVADAYDPRHPSDAQPAPGVPLVRIGASLGTGGLASAGEPLVLRDRAGRRIAEMPAVAAPRAGHCVVRVTAYSRRSSTSDYAPSSNGACTPGAADPWQTGAGAEAREASPPP